MGMAADKLLGEAGRHVVDVPGRRAAGALGRDPGVEQHLHEHIAELLAQLGVVAVLDRLKRLVGLLQQVGGKGRVGLLRVPRATAGRAQPVHHGDRVQELRPGQVTRTLARRNGEVRTRRCRECGQQFRLADHVR